MTIALSIPTTLAEEAEHFACPDTWEAEAKVIKAGAYKTLVEVADLAALDRLAQALFAAADIARENGDRRAKGWKNAIIQSIEGYAGRLPYADRYLSMMG